MRCLLLLSILMVFAAACTPARSTAAPAGNTPPAEASLPSGPPTPAPPTRFLQFPDLAGVQRASLFPVWVPGFVPDDIPFSEASLADYADGSETVSIIYAEPGNPLDANRKMLVYWMTKTDEPVSRYSVSHQFKTLALDVREVRTRGQTGFTYWTRAVAAGNSAVLAWREGGFNLQISLYGAWPQPDEGNPHGLDSILLNVAASLQPFH